QNLCRTRILQFDEVGLVLDVERRAQPLGQWRIGGAYLYADPANRRMCQEAASEQRMVLGLHGASRAQAFDPLGASTAGSVQAEPGASRSGPALYGMALRGVGVGAGHVGDHQAADGQPFLEIREVIGDRSRDVLFGQQPQEPQAGIVMVMSSHRTRRETTCNKIRTALRRLLQRITSLALLHPARQLVPVLPPLCVRLSPTVLPP